MTEMEVLFAVLGGLVGCCILKAIQWLRGQNNKISNK